MTRREVFRAAGSCAAIALLDCVTWYVADRARGERVRLRERLNEILGRARCRAAGSSAADD